MVGCVHVMYNKTEGMPCARQPGAQSCRSDQGTAAGKTAPTEKGASRLKTTRSFFHSPVFRKFMLSFLAAFMLPISLLFGYLDYTNRALLTREIYDIQDASVNYMRRTMDFEYARYRTFAAMLLNNADISRLRRMDYASMTPADTLRLKDVRGVLSSFAADPSVVSRIFLYMPTNGM